MGAIESINKPLKRHDVYIPHVSPTAELDKGLKNQNERFQLIAL